MRIVGYSTFCVQEQDLARALQNKSKICDLQPKDILQYAAEYFMAMAGIGTACSQQGVDPPAAAAPAAAIPSAEPTLTSAPLPAAAQQHNMSNYGVEAAGWRRISTTVLDRQPSAKHHMDGPDASATAASQHEAVALMAPSRRGADGTNADDTDDVASLMDISPSAAWGVSGGGQAVPSLPLVSQLYAARRTSDRQMPAVWRSTTEPPAAQQPAGSIGNANTSPTTSPAQLVQQDEGVAALADVDAASSSPEASVGPAPAGSPAPEGDAVPAVDVEDAALVALAEREAISRLQLDVIISTTSLPGCQHTFKRNSQCVRLPLLAAWQVCSKRRTPTPVAAWTARSFGT